ncbi:MAG TPA: FUSC family protein, partial [Inquilinus sp.]
MSTATSLHPLSFAGVPLRSWAFGIRIWIAVVVALAAGFWLQLEAPSSAAITVAILAAPTRGPALEKACYRLLATFLGVTAAIVIAGLFSQSRDLILAAFAAWLGLCVYAAGVLDGNRAYAAVLSGYTVAIVAIEQLDTPQLVFETAVARGAAIVVGIAVVAVVNDLLATPDSHPRLAAQLAAIHSRVRDYAKAVLRDEMTDASSAAGLLRDIAALRPELA